MRDEVVASFEKNLHNFRVVTHFVLAISGPGTCFVFFENYFFFICSISADMVVDMTEKVSGKYTEHTSRD